jgi:dolichol-phosphate mannosyltransferase
MPEEAYYWNYSRHLDIGYLDHPPMTAWLIQFGTAVFGTTEFGVRIGALICSAVTSYFIFRLARNIFGDAVSWATLVLLQALPFFFLSGVLMTPDAPLCAAWAAALYFFERALIAGQASAWLWAGMSVGLGLISKYTIALLGIAVVLFLWLDPVSRRWLRRWEPYAGAIAALVIFSPVIVWNAQHEWASFAFQTARRLADVPRFSLHRLLASALVLITPTGVFAAAVALWPRAGSTGGEVQRASRLLRLAVLVPLTVFAVFSLRHEVKLDWTGAPWVAAVPLMAPGMWRPADGSRRNLRARIAAAWTPTLVILALIYGASFIYFVRGIPGIGYPEHMELVPVGWRELGQQVHESAQDYRRRSGVEPLIVGLDRYAIASELAFYAPDRAASVRGTTSSQLFGNEGLMYGIWFPKQQQRGRTLLLVSLDRSSIDAPGIKSSVDAWEPVMSGGLQRNGAAIRPYYYRFARGYRDTPRTE